jgi:SAM-dependent methyltransferase
MIAACRSCGVDGLAPVLSLGRMPLANALLTVEQLDQPERRFPLEVVFCRRCALVQITETVPPDQLFREYLYFSSFSDEILQHARELVDQVIVLRRLNSNSRVVEIASNDGYLLRNYKERSIPVLGIEPAVNVARVAREQHGIPTLCEFFGRELARQLQQQGMRADVIHAHNVLAHVPDLNGFVEGLRVLLQPDGVAIIEVPYVRDLIEHCAFDTIYHEHLCYFSLTSLVRLLAVHGMFIEQVEHVPIHGGSLLLFVTHYGHADRQPSVVGLLQEEAELGVCRANFYRHFAHRVEDVRSSLCHLLRQLKQNGKRLAAYGAAAKGAILLNYCGIGREVLDFVVDRSPYKQGRYMPGVHLPIYSPAKLLESIPEYVLLLSWNLAPEILHQQSEYRRRGGCFILPVPEPRIV